MADSATTNLALVLPEVGASADSWGTKLNSNAIALDAIFAAGGTAVSMGAVKFDNVRINDTSHAGITNGLLVNQGAADNLIAAFKSSDVATGLTTGTVGQDPETDDFLTISKESATIGGAQLQAIAETTSERVLSIYTYGGAPETADAINSRAAMNFFVAQHDGANALQDMAANSNGFCWGEVAGDGSLLTRMLLKADDGELHLGNATLVALDAEDDVQAVRGLQVARSGGVGIKREPWEPARDLYSYEDLYRLGVVGARNERGEFLIRVQPYLNLHDGALWQLYCALRETREALRLVLAGDTDGAAGLLNA